MAEQSYRGLFATLAVIGVLILLACAGIQLYGAVTRNPYEINHAVFYVGMVIGFVGFYGLDPKRAKDGGDFLVSSATRFIVAVRGGRRSTDVTIAQVTTPPTPPEMPDKPRTD